MQDSQEMCPVHASFWDHFPTEPSCNLTSCTCKPHSFPPPKCCRQLPPPARKKLGTTFIHIAQQHCWGNQCCVFSMSRSYLFHVTPAGSIFSSNHHVSSQQRSLARRHCST